MRAQSGRTFSGGLRLAAAIAAVAASFGCSKPASLKGVQATQAQVEATITTTTSGTVTADQQAILGFASAGRIASVSVAAGDVVKEGQVLAQLENRDLLATLRDAESDLKRIRQLFKSDLSSRSALEDAQRAYEVAKANYDKSIIRAPFAGLVTEVNLEVGELSSPTAQAPTPPIRMVDLKPRIIRGQVDEIDLARVKQGAAARVKILAVSPSPLPGVVTRVVPFVSTTKEQDRTSEVELKLTGDRELIPVGSSADIEIITDSKLAAVAIPSRAMLGSGADRYVFRLIDGKLQRTSVKAGVGNYERTEILSGLQAGELVALPSDSVELKDGMKAQVEKTPWP